MEILLRLPVKSIIRFSCVSKAWYDLINGPTFAKCLNGSLGTNFDLLILDGRSLRCFSLDHGIESAPIVDHLLNRALVGCSEVVGSCNGLLCYHNSDADRLTFYSSLTRMHKILPSSPVLDGSSNFPSGRLVINYGFGYDSAGDDYKCAEIPIPNSIRGLNHRHLEVLGGSLSFWHDSHNFEIWVMMEYGITESWTRLLHIGIMELFACQLTYPCPVAYLKAENRVLFEALQCGRKRLFWWDMKNRKRTPCETYHDFPSYFEAMVCSRSQAEIALPHAEASNLQSQGSRVRVLLLVMDGDMNVASSVRKNKQSVPQVWGSCSLWNNCSFKKVANISRDIRIEELLRLIMMVKQQPCSSSRCSPLYSLMLLDLFPYLQYGLEAGKQRHSTYEAVGRILHNSATVNGQFMFTAFSFVVNLIMVIWLGHNHKHHACSKEDHDHGGKWHAQLPKKSILIGCLERLDDTALLLLLLNVAAVPPPKPHYKQETLFVEGIEARLELA
ncbi:hypothetical protein Ancab_011563 [Ancistrocladus abbreviatus]